MMGLLNSDSGLTTLKDSPDTLHRASQTNLRIEGNLYGTSFAHVNTYTKREVTFPTHTTPR